MGNSSSHTHQQFDRAYTRDAYGDVKNTVRLLFTFYFVFISVCLCLLFITF